MANNLHTAGSAGITIPMTHVAITPAAAAAWQTRLAANPHGGTARISTDPTGKPAVESGGSRPVGHSSGFHRLGANRRSS